MSVQKTMIDVEKLAPLSKAILIENTPPAGRLVRAIVKLDEQILKPTDEVSETGSCRSTNMTYSVSYSPTRIRRAHNTQAQRKPAPFMYSYLIVCDMFYPRGVARFKDWEDFSHSSHPVAIWLLRNTNISKKMFEIAHTNVYMKIPFCINYTSYLSKVKYLGGETDDPKRISKK